MVDKLSPSSQRSMLRRSKNLWSTARSLISTTDSSTAVTVTSMSTVSSRSLFSSGNGKRVRFAESVRVRLIRPQSSISDQEKKILYYSPQERRAMRATARKTASTIGSLYPDQTSSLQRLWSKAHLLADSRSTQEVEIFLSDSDCMSRCASEITNWIANEGHSMRGLENLLCSGRRRAARASRALVIDQARACFAHDQTSNFHSIALQYEATSRYASILARMLAAADASEKPLLRQPDCGLKSGAFALGLKGSQRLVV